MKELQKINPDKKIVTPAEERKSKFLGSVRKHSKNHKIWQYEDGEVTLADVEEYVALTPDKKTTGKTRLVMKEGCHYYQALNKKNAIRHFEEAGLIVKDKL